jgi:hypothetical protein
MKIIFVGTPLKTAALALGIFLRIQKLFQHFLLVPPSLEPLWHSAPDRPSMSEKSGSTRFMWQGVSAQQISSFQNL